MLSIVLPCYNPPEYWDKRVLSEYRNLGTRIGEPVELIVVNDGSRQGVTAEQIATLQREIPLFRYLHYAENRGKGYAIRHGMRAAEGELLIYTDIDFPYSADSFLEIYRHLREGACDVAVGVKDSHYYRNTPPARRFISRTLRYLVRAFLRMPVTDTQCGLKGFRREVLPLFLRTRIDRYLFDLEFIRNAYSSKKYRIQPMPVRLNEGVVFRRMNYRLLVPELINFMRVSFQKPDEA
jgi:glycosyltransferase involved in cell wall biosynthesis